MIELLQGGYRILGRFQSIPACRSAIDAGWKDCQDGVANELQYFAAVSGNRAGNPVKVRVQHGDNIVWRHLIGHRGEVA